MMCRFEKKSQLYVVSAGSERSFRRRAPSLARYRDKDDPMMLVIVMTRQTIPSNSIADGPTSCDFLCATALKNWAPSRERDGSLAVDLERGLREHGTLRCLNGKIYSRS